MGTSDDDVAGRLVERPRVASLPQRAPADVPGEPGGSARTTWRWHHGVVTATLERFVVVSGPPGSGKTTLATALAAGLELPLITKDAIKEAMLSVLTVSDSPASQELGRAAMAVLYRLAGDSKVGAILEANFRRSKSVEALEQLPGTKIELHCRCSSAVALRRYRSRQASRHPGHFDAMRTDSELWDPDMVGPLAGDWPVLEVATDGPVDVPSILRTIREHLATTEPRGGPPLGV